MCALDSNFWGWGKLVKGWEKTGLISFVIVLHLSSRPCFFSVVGINIGVGIGFDDLMGGGGGFYTSGT